MTNTKIRRGQKNMEPDQTPTTESASSGTDKAQCDSAPENTQEKQPTSRNWFETCQYGSDDDIKSSAREEMTNILHRHKMSHYHVLIMYDNYDHGISNWHTDQLYNAAA